MDLDSFISLKNNVELNNLSNEMNILINLLGMSKKNNKSQPVKGVQFLKNPKIQNLKDKIENKINLILNKLSENNFENLLVEFIESMGKISEDDYNVIQKTFYLKMQSDISFVKIYVDFFNIISKLYNELFNLQPIFFINILEAKVNYDYMKCELTDVFSFLKEQDDIISPETKRINHMIIIKNMIEHKKLNQSFVDYFDKLILNQNIYYSDIYYWFQNNSLTSCMKQTIKSIILNNALPLRDKVLLDNLLLSETKEPSNMTSVTTTVKETKDNNISIDTLEIESFNIIDEFLHMNSYNDVKKFIDTRCKDAISKNNFCKYILFKYFESSNDMSIILLDFIDNLINKQYLFKNNFNKGLLSIYEDWDDISLDFNNTDNKMNKLLNNFKTINNTKNLEHIFKKFKI